MPKKIFVTVSGGVAYAVEESVPLGYELEIIDFDNIKEGDDSRSDEAKKILFGTRDELNGERLWTLYALRSLASSTGVMLRSPVW